MSSAQYRNQLERKRRQRVDAERKAGEYRSTEAQKRCAATSSRAAALKSRSSATASGKHREAERFERDAATAGKQAAQWQDKASRYATEELSLQQQLARAERSEGAASIRRQEADRRQADRRAAADYAILRRRLDATESLVGAAFRDLRSPRPERLRVLILGAASSGDLRVGREQKRIRAAVESALNRDQIEIDARPAATAGDLLDGVTKFRPHVVHFSGHSNEDLIVLEDEIDEHHDGVIVTAGAFASAVAATDDPPLLVLLNSCRSAAQIADLASIHRLGGFEVGRGSTRKAP
jgi:hypothetical protein